MIFVEISRGREEESEGRIGNNKREELEDDKREGCKNEKKIDSVMLCIN